MLGIIILVLVLGRPKKAPTSVVTQISTIQPTKTQKVTIERNLVQEKIFFSYLNGDSIYYLGNKGIIPRKYSFKNKKTENLSDQEILGAIAVDFSPDGAKLIFKTEINPDEIKNQLVNFQKRTSVEINKNIELLEWLPDSKKIIYHYIEPAKDLDQIAIANPDVSDWQKITDIKFAISQIKLSPDGKYLAIISGEGAHLGENNLYILDIANKKLNQITEDGYSANPIWNNPNQIIWERINPENMLIGLNISQVNGKGEIQNKKDLGVVNIPQKVTWRNDKEIIVAISKNIPDDYASDPTFRLSSNDDIYIINIDTGEKTKLEFSLLEDDLSFGRLAVENLMITADGSQLFFTSNDQLYGIRLNE